MLGNSAVAGFCACYVLLFVLVYMFCFSLVVGVYDLRCGLLGLCDLVGVGLMWVRVINSVGIVRLLMVEFTRLLYCFRFLYMAAACC